MQKPERQRVERDDIYDEQILEPDPHGSVYDADEMDEYLMELEADHVSLKELRDAVRELAREKPTM